MSTHSLHEWSDMLVDDVRFPEMGKDQFGNTIDGAAVNVTGFVTSRNVSGGGRLSEDTAAQQDNVGIQVVTPYFLPVPEVGQRMLVNNVRHEITSVEVYDDQISKCFVVSASNMEETGQ